VARTSTLRLNGLPLPLDRPWWQQLREPEAGLGSGWATWLYSERPRWFRSLPRGTRVHRARTALGPAGAPWLRPRVDGIVPTLLGHRVQWAKGEAGKVVVGLDDAGGSHLELTADHVISATGYRVDLGRLRFLDDELLARIETLAGSPVVDRHFRCSLPGLHFVGPAVAPSFGPAMRFVYGAAFAAERVAGHVAGSGARRVGAVAGNRR
jgi:FAD-dependent urate hydroxylase